MTLAKVHGGKVRDLYSVDADTLLMVASDRISAFDVVMAEPIPDKGRVLTAMSAFWFEHLSDLAPNHLVSADPADFPDAAGDIPGVAGRAMLVRRAEMMKLECIVRGYLSGSAWREYRRSGTVHGMAMPADLQESAKLDSPVFTPSTKADAGHDENISFAQAAAIVGTELAVAARDLSLAAYDEAARWAADRGVLIADTKFELGLIDGGLALCDEVLTPDSSRFWEASAWSPGSTPPSLDKEPLRRWLAESAWDQEPPPPPLTATVVDESRRRYLSAYERVTGRRLADWWGAEP
ncbi:MAG: phosphoribosylaminoimidazolesuccinocarboxamide synthase [Acidimicrobiales bacterium]